ncbi:MAG TPA: tripartite tricarboxylate transporter substrate binding protein [Ramlibacter sp.]|nr:tripartite tricarboxylate transporter substrate binding protein [Ramlibacter sp.]
MKTRLFALLAAASLFCGNAGAQAPAPDGYPSKPVTIVVQYPAGSAMDVVARLFGDAFTRKTGQPAIVVNRVGGGGNVAVNSMVNAAPDGYTLMFPGTVISPVSVTDPKSAAAFWNALTPVTELTRAPLLCATTPKTQATTLEQFIAWTKKSERVPFFGTSGVGGTPHFLIENLKAATGMRMTHVPFQGAPPAILAAAQGDIDFLCEATFLMKPFVDERKLVPLALSVSQPDANFPNLPALKAHGLADAELGVWHGIFAPVKTPPATVQRINSVLQGVLKDPELSKRLMALGYLPVGAGPDEFKAKIDGETRRLKKIAADLNLKFEY